MLGRHGEKALPHVHQSLSYPDEEQSGGLLVVVATEASEKPSQPGIVGASTYEPWRRRSEP